MERRKYKWQQKKNIWLWQQPAIVIPVVVTTREGLTVVFFVGLRDLEKMFHTEQ